jgi:hypothetical protein
VHPGESRLDDPATRLGDKAALEIDPADDLDREPQDPAHGLHDAAGVALLGPQMASPGAAVAGSAEQPGHRRPILDAGRGDKHGHQQASVSTTTWRLMPSIFLTPSKPRGPRTGDNLIEQESITPAEGSGLRPWAWRTWVLQLARSRSQVPSRVQRRKCLWVADQETAPVVEQHPSGAAGVVDGQDRGDVLAPTPCGARPPALWVGVG